MTKAKKSPPKKARTAKRLAWITGASTGIGAATAQRLAKDGWDVCISARSKDKLKALADNSVDYPGTIYAYPCDVTKMAQVADVVSQIESERGPITLALLNAGTYFGQSEKEFTAENFQKTFDVNVNGVARCLEPVLKNFLKRKAGHIAIVASVVGYRGLPRSLAYGPSKAALINLAEALHIMTSEKGIKVQVINPGFIKTPLTDQNDFDMPMLMEVEDAADRLVDGLYSNRFEINFPWPFCYTIRWLGLLPNKIYLYLVRKLIRVR